MVAASKGERTSTPARWVRPASDTAPMTWGRTDGLVFGLPSERGMPGPRGLIRVGVWNAAAKTPDLMNFVAIEPVVTRDGSRGERMAYSELEHSTLDAPHRGKRLWTRGPASGDLTRLPSGAEQLSVTVEVERFTANDAHVWLTARMRSDRPDEVALAVHHHDDSASIAEHTLTATMGNYERLRLLWLRDRVVDSRDLYAGYEDVHFVERDAYALADLARLDDGSVLAACATDEEDPSSVRLTSPWWSYDCAKLTQFWREHARPDLRVYWAGDLEIPGGVSFENFEMRQEYVPGQEFVFGLTAREPRDLVPDAESFAL